MLSFDYFRRPVASYSPKTSAAAFRAVKFDLLPVEKFVFVCTSVSPLDDEPVDLDGLEQTLGRGNLDIETNLMLMRVFGRLLNSPEQEVALFAAEGINLIEDRYNKSIEELKSDPSHRKDPEKVRELARLYYEIAQLYEKESAIHKFYLKEAYQWSSAIETVDEYRVKNREQTIRVLIQLGLLDQAMKEVEKAGKERSAEFLLLEAEIEYERHHYDRVTAICGMLSHRIEKLSKEQQLLVARWLETDEQ